MYQDYCQPPKQDGCYMPFTSQDEGVIDEHACSYANTYLGSNLNTMQAPMYLSIGIPPRTQWSSPEELSLSPVDNAFPSPLTPDSQPSPTNSQFDCYYSPAQTTSANTSPVATPLQSSFFFAAPRTVENFYQPSYDCQGRDTEGYYFATPLPLMDMPEKLSYPTETSVDYCPCTPLSAHPSHLHGPLQHADSHSSISPVLASSSCPPPPEPSHPYPLARQGTRVQPGSRPYPCYACHRTFARKHDLQRHIRVHTGCKPYICQCCKKAFARTDALKRHLRMEETCRTSPEIQALKCTGKRRYRNL